MAGAQVMANNAGKRDCGALREAAS